MEVTLKKKDVMTWAKAYLKAKDKQKWSSKAVNQEKLKAAAGKWMSATVNEHVMKAVWVDVLLS